MGYGGKKAVTAALLMNGAFLLGAVDMNGDMGLVEGLLRWVDGTALQIFIR